MWCSFSGFFLGVGYFAAINHLHQYVVYFWGKKQSLDGGWGTGIAVALQWLFMGVMLLNDPIELIDIRQYTGLISGV